MSNQAQIDRLTKAKADIKAAIESKGVAVPGGALLDQYAPLINQIQQGTQIPAETLAIVKIFTANDTFTVPQTGNYKITVIGKGGKGVKPLSGLAPYKPTNHGFPPFGVGGGGGSRFYDSPYNAFLGGGPGGFGAVIVELVLK